MFNSGHLNRIKQARTQFSLNSFSRAGRQSINAYATVTRAMPVNKKFQSRKNY